MNQSNLTVNEDVAGSAKHERFASALDHINGIERSLDALISRCMKEEEDNEKSTDIPAPPIPYIPSLVQVLNETPDIIHKAMERMEAQITELNKLLF